VDNASVNDVCSILLWTIITFSFSFATREIARPILKYYREKGEKKVFKQLLSTYGTVTD